jgi:hypothetical protein
MATLSVRYRVVATVCGAPIYLHRGEKRILPGQGTPCPD